MALAIYIPFPGDDSNSTNQELVSGNWKVPTQGLVMELINWGLLYESLLL